MTELQRPKQLVEYSQAGEHWLWATDFQLSSRCVPSNQSVSFNYDKKGIEHNLICRNDVTTRDYQRSIQNLERMQPQMLAPFLLTAAILSSFKERIERQTTLIETLVADPVSEYGMDPSWIQIYPDRSLATAEERGPIIVTAALLWRRPLARHRWIQWLR